MFGIKGRDTFNNPLSDRAKFAASLKERWLKYFPYFLFLLIAIVVTFGGYVWYAYVYTKELSEEETTIYINQKKQEVIFREKKFNELKDQIIQRAERFDEQRKEYNDIFYHVKKITTEE